jgi:hypothetical protein
MKKALRFVLTVRPDTRWVSLTAGLTRSTSLLSFPPFLTIFEALGKSLPNYYPTTAGEAASAGLSPGSIISMSAKSSLV